MLKKAAPVGAAVISNLPFCSRSGCANICGNVTEDQNQQYVQHKVPLVSHQES